MLRRPISTTPRAGRRAPQRARLVRALAGLVAGARQNRRGSFLIMVVGTLALLAVITIVYVSIGRTDSQTSAAASKHSGRDDVPERMRDYVAGIIADDLFDVLYLGQRDQAGRPVFVREAFDYPSSPYQTVLPQQGGGGDTPPTIITVGDGNDARFWFDPTGNYTGTDPWLASSTPTLLNFDGSASSETNPADYFTERLDWLQLSNVAPDGMFVNLWNLRDKGFDANPWQMREELTLFEAEPDSGNRGLALDYGGQAHDPTDQRARPSEWTARQRWAFHPKVEPRFDPTRSEYLLYQYADADGDGFLDSRWFEMVEARDPSEPWTRLLPNDERLRFFFAVRAEDLSGRVNVNTATDATLAPVREDPLGLYPSAVDLRTLLTLQNSYADATLNFGYDEFEQPKGGAGEQDYSNYDVDNAYLAGDKAYDALRTTLDVAVLPPIAGLAGLEALDTGTGIEREFSTVAGGGTLNPYWSSYWKLQGNPPLGPSGYYELFAGYGPDGGAGLLNNPNTPSGIGRPFTADSLFELLAFRGVNDVRVRSPLEAALGGRAAYADSGNDLANFSPLRDNRSTSLERDGRYTVGKGGGSFDLDGKAWSVADIRQLLTTHSGARPIAPTTIPESAANPGRPDTASLPLDDNDLKENIKDLLDEGSLGKIYHLLADALLPWSDVQSHWTRPAQYDTGGAANAKPSDTLYYGYRGPELALRTAAHMALNLMDAYDEDGSPTGRNVILVEGIPGFGAELRLPAGRVPTNSGDVLSPTVAMFGIEAQPFVTEAASYVMYTDTLESRGGDTDGDPTNDGDPSDAGPITIQGDIDPANEDFLFQVIAFQVHNPFNEPLDLTADGGQHYVEYGSFYYKLVDDENGGQPILLDARDSSGDGNTRVVYYVDPPPDDTGAWTEIGNRLANATGSGDPAAEIARFESWLDNQLGVDAVRVQCYTDQAMTAEAAAFQSELLNDAAEGGVVQLYRNDPNVQPADVLVDRLRDPDRDNTLDRTLPVGSHDIDGASEDFDGQGDNAGLTITRHANMRRREDPRAGSAANPPLGGLPAYCIESKSQSYLKNLDDTDGSDRTSLDRTDFNGPNGDDTVDGALIEQSGGGATLVDTVTTAPEDKGGGGLSKDAIRGNKSQRAFGGSADSAPLYVEPHLNNDEFEVNDISTMRVADVFLPLGIGPHYSANEGWTTLSEALAYALYYDDYADSNNQNYGTDPLPPTVYAGAFVTPPPTNYTEFNRSLLHNGHVRYDSFVPFWDANVDGFFDPASEARWGLGVPLAATLFDTLTTMPRAYGSLLSPTHGQININTAPREVARALPGLSPPPDTGPDGSTPNWWWSGGSSLHNSESDIATTLVAFRDRLNLFTRDLGPGPTAINFRDSFADPFDASSARSLPPNGLPPGYDTSGADNARHGATAVMALRQRPGFWSLGELAFLRDFAAAPPGGAQFFPHDIDRLAYDTVDLDQPGLDTTRYDTDGDGLPDGDDQIEDDFDERLALVSGVVNSATVRSDLFAVWFVVHGYREEDTKNLGPDEPLIPTVARRFVMVVDRSNVTVPGEKPRIVLFKEVPL